MVGPLGYFFQINTLFDDLDADLLPSLSDSLPRTLFQNQHLQPQIRPEHNENTLLKMRFCDVFTDYNKPEET